MIKEEKAVRAAGTERLFDERSGKMGAASQASRLVIILL
jgi:hypothetical protein